MNGWCEYIQGLMWIWITKWNSNIKVSKVACIYIRWNGHRLAAVSICKLYIQYVYAVCVCVCICICFCSYIRMVILQYCDGDTNLCCTHYYARRFATIFVFFYSCCKQITKCISYFIFRIELVVSSSASSSSSLSVFPIFATRHTLTTVTFRNVS